MRSGSAFKPFQLPLSDGRHITGISYVPERTTKHVPYVPLIVGLHGGTCNANIFDLAENSNTSLACKNLEIPFVAFNRLNYADSSTFKAPEGVPYRQEEGRLTHELILPALWAAFGKPNGCTGVVLFASSMGVPGSIVAAALHSQEATPAYPLAGMIFSGWGTRTTAVVSGAELPPRDGPQQIMWPIDFKRTVMVSGDELKCGDPSIMEGLEKEHTFVLVEELYGSVEWLTYWKQFAEQVTKPVMISFGEHDFLWHGTKEHAEEFGAAFTQSERVDTSIILGAPHGLECWRGTNAWYYRSFAWAAEVCSSMAVKEMQQSK